MYQSYPLPELPQTVPQPGSIVTTALGDVRIIRAIGRGKSGYSYEAALGQRRVVFKQMHDEPCTYYSFEDSKTRLEEKDYFRLRDMGIHVPRLLHVGHEGSFLIKEYISGPTAAEVIASELPDREIIAQLFDIARKCRTFGKNIDYFPTNFVIENGCLYYVDYETNTFDPRWSLEHWGAYFWANCAGWHNFLQTGSSSLLHSDPDNGIPLKEPFEPIVRQWISDFGETGEQQAAAAAPPFLDPVTKSGEAP
ncbi:MAG: hypothetical protein C0600_13390 [Ignavibacteria bacterium]|nr:MAG: hypothetical protein C0600_13390 [Ignavibacteria bacterium]